MKVVCRCARGYRNRNLDMIAEVKEIAVARCRTKKQENEKKAWMMLRVRFCACGEKADIKFGDICSSCEQRRCS